MLEKLNSVFSTDDIDIDKVDSNIGTFFRGCMGLVTIYHDDINLHDDNFNENDLETIIHVGFMAWFNSFKQRKEGKKR